MKAWRFCADKYAIALMDDSAVVVHQHTAYE